MQEKKYSGQKKAPGFSGAQKEKTED